jgi:hypothetical protein
MSDLRSHSNNAWRNISQRLPARQAEAVRLGIERVAGASALYLTSDEAEHRSHGLGHEAHLGSR